MPQNKDFALRIEILDECLRNRYRKWTLQTLIDAVNEKLQEQYGKDASKRTIQDDLKFMKEEKGAPIERRKDGTTTYFYYTDTNFSIKNLPIKEEEINLLNDAINILRQVSDFKILEDVDEIVQKLQNKIKTNVTGSASIIQFEKHTEAAGTGFIDNIFTAIKEKTPLRIKYHSFKAAQPEECILHPYLLKEYRNRWFVIGRKNTSDAFSNLALDRIKDLKNSSVEYVENNLFNPDTYFNNLIGVTVPEGVVVQDIDISVSEQQAPYVKTKPIHHTQVILQEYPDGKILIRLYLIANYELQSVLLGYGADIEVIKPDSLRETMKTIFMKTAEIY